MRLGVNIEYDGKHYDILELPPEAFLQLVPGLTMEQLKRIEERFREYWPEQTLLRHHILEFAAEQAGMSMDFLLIHRQRIPFSEADLKEYIEDHAQQTGKPS